MYEEIITKEILVVLKYKSGKEARDRCLEVVKLLTAISNCVDGSSIIGNVACMCWASPVGSILDASYSHRSYSNRFRTATKSLGGKKARGISVGQKQTRTTFPP